MESHDLKSNPAFRFLLITLAVLVVVTLVILGVLLLMVMPGAEVAAASSHGVLRPHLSKW